MAGDLHIPFIVWGCTIMLEDIALQLELPVDGYAITGFSKVAKPVILCNRLLCQSPGDKENKFTNLKFCWLK